ncbi:lactate permease LctP family transporter [Fodinisporobacter ferrooxydans]|uniref:L-lactate permease n=1 Tax=Fodinisporobacter ferrooxydans TaxID=2901836 RepID=A0ABY4CNW8_9BACL|nr:lactate permease LctP family transporter [Alicyclobacillaceae bacterium MYW30-H2]
MTWTQGYAPVGGSIWLSALFAVVPILYFLWALGMKGMKGHVAALTTVVLAILDAIAIFHFPVGKAVSSTLYGMVTGLWPIGWIVVTSVLVYNITVKTGHFDVIRQSISGLTDDRRIQMLLIAFCFGAFLEGAAGFGAPVAIAGAMLVGLGFSPLYAAGLCLIADTAPVAFGGLGIPVTAMAGVTHANPLLLSQVIGRQLPLLSLFLPFLLVIIMSGWKGLKEVFPAALTAGASFAIVQFLTSNYLGPQLPDVLSAIVSLLSLVILLKFWKPKTTFRFAHEAGQAEAAASVAAHDLHGKANAKGSTAKHTAGEVFQAWLPYIVLTIVLIIWTLPGVKKELANFTHVFHFPGLDNEILKVAPIAAKPTKMPALYTFDIFAATGTAIFLTAVITKFITGMSTKDFFKTIGETLNQLKYPLLTIALVVGYGQLTNYSGMSGTMALALAKTGFLFPFFAPLLGWIGVFLTGSDTSSNLLFGNLQQLTAQQLHINQYLTMGANSSGGVVGKMISPQSIAVGASATGLVGKEGQLYRFTLKYSILLLAVIAVITFLQAYVVPGMIPGK